MVVEKRKIIGNIGMLDMRTATEASIDRIAKIGNVGTILCSQETKQFITKLQIGNAGSVVVAPENARLLSGQETIGKDAFSDHENPATYVISGQVLFASDIPEDDIRNGLKELNASGQLVVPKHLAGLLQTKMVEMSGQILEYEGSPKILMGKQSITSGYLEGLEDGTELLVFGRVDFPDVIPNELIHKKLRRIQIMGRLRLREENHGAILGAMSGEHTARVTVIPSGFTVVSNRTTVDMATLASLSARKLYFEDEVEIVSEVTSEAFAEAVEEMVPTGRIICPDHLKDTLAERCDLLAHPPVYTTGPVWRVDDEMSVAASRFDFIDEPVTVVVTGELYVDADVEAAKLHASIARVHNFGEIYCTKEQMGALQAREIPTRKGEYIDSQAEPGAEPEPGEQFERIGNAGTLRI
jgi:hypothetical protein